MWISCVLFTEALCHLHLPEETFGAKSFLARRKTWSTLPDRSLHENVEPKIQFHPRQMWRISDEHEEQDVESETTTCGQASSWNHDWSSIFCTSHRSRLSAMATTEIRECGCHVQRIWTSRSFYHGHM